MEENYDILIVGAGTGGVVSAITAAKSGIDVCLIDSKPKEKIGDKVCGDIIWKDYFDVLRKRIGIDHPEGDELNHVVSGLKIIAPDGKTSIQLGQDHYMIDRHKFGQRLVDKAINTGATLLDGLRVVEPIIRDNAVVGVIAKDHSTNEKRSVYGNVVIDASGAIPVLRDKVILENSFLERNVSKNDMAISYREVRTLKDDIPDKDTAKIYLSNKLFNGGYSWIFPDGDRTVNIGVGKRMSLNSSNMKSMFLKNIEKSSIFDGSNIINRGGGVLPVRMPLHSLVANGFMCVGDAGCQVNPLSGAGIELSMNGGYLAAKAAIEAISNDDVSQEMLWDYNKNYMSEYGVSNASADIFRIFLQYRSDSEINFGMKHLITEKSIEQINSGKKVDISSAEKSKIILKGIGKLGFISKFKSIIENMNRISELCKNYPQPSEFKLWKSKLDDIYSDTLKIVK